MNALVIMALVGAGIYFTKKRGVPDMQIYPTAQPPAAGPGVPSITPPAAPPSQAPYQTPSVTSPVAPVPVIFGPGVENPIVGTAPSIAPSGSNPIAVETGEGGWYETNWGDPSTWNIYDAKAVETGPIFISPSSAANIFQYVQDGILEPWVLVHLRKWGPYWIERAFNGELYILTPADLERQGFATFADWLRMFNLATTGGYQAIGI